MKKMYYLLGIFILMLLCSSFDENFCRMHTNGYYPDPENCAAFYICDSGETRYEYCNSGMYFNEKNRMCDYKENVLCTTSKAHGRSQICQCEDGTTGNYYDCDVRHSSSVDCVMNSPCYKDLSIPISICGTNVP